MPTVDELKAKVSLLQGQYEAIEAEGNFQFKVLKAYSTQVTSKLLAILNGDPSFLLPDLETLLNENWELVKHSPLTYTALPNHEITTLLIDVAKFLVDKKKELSPTESFSALTTLMRGITVDSILDRVDAEGHRLYPDFDGTEDIHDLLKTHILDQSGAALLPIRLLTELDITTESEAIINPYYDYRQVETMEPYLRLGEKERLYTHSSLTKDIIDAKKNYELILNDKNNLLGHLRQLCTLLAFNSAYGVGTETNAGMGAYNAILTFNSYYQVLSEDEKARIPADLRVEIELLINLASNPEANLNATETIETCIATRRERLERNMRGNEETLSGIGLTGETRVALLRESQALFVAAKQTLITALNTKTYLSGQDVHGVTQALLRALDVTFSISSQTDLETIKTLMPTEITALMADETIKQQFLDQIDTIENLVIFAIETSPDKLKTLFQSIGPLLFAQKIIHPRDLVALLISLNPERIEVIVEALQDNIAAMPINVIGRMMRSLAPESCGAFLRGMQKLLPTLIRTADDVAALISSLPNEQRTNVFLILKDDLLTIIKSGADMESLFSKLLPEESATVFRIIEPHLSSIIKEATDLSKALSYCTSEQRTAIITALHDVIPTLIKTGNDFKIIYENLSPEQKDSIFTTVQEKISTIVTTSADLKNVLEFLSDEQRNIVFMSMKDRLSPMITNLGELYNLMLYLTPTQFASILPAIEDKLPRIIHSGENLLSVLYRLPEMERTVVLTKMRDHLSSLRMSPNYLREMNELLTSEQRMILLHGLKDKFPTLINSLPDLRISLTHLDPAGCVFIMTQLKPKIPQLIRNFTDLKYALDYLFIASLRTAVLNTLTTNLPAIVTSLQDLNDLVNFLNPDQCLIALTAIKQNIPRIIRNTIELQNILRFLPEDKISAILASIGDSLPLIIKTPTDLKNIFTYLKPTHYIPILSKLVDNLPSMFKTGQELVRFLNEKVPSANIAQALIAIKASLPAIINTAKDLANTLMLLPSESLKTLVFEAVKDKLPLLATTKEDLVITISGFTPEQCAIALRIMQAQIPTLLKTTEDLLFVLSRLTHAQQYAALLALQGSLPGMITTMADLRSLLAPLDPELRSPVFMAMKDHIAPLIETDEDLNTILEYLTPEERRDPVFQLSSLVLDIAKQSVSPEDVLLTTYVSEAKSMIKGVDKAEAFTTLQREFTEILASVRSPQVEEVKEAIRALRGGVAFYTIGKNKKAQLIEDALCALPLEKRGTVLSSATNGVQLAMASGRITGTAHGSTHFKPLKDKYEPDDDKPKKGAGGPRT